MAHKYLLPIFPAIPKETLYYAAENPMKHNMPCNKTGVAFSMSSIFFFFNHTIFSN